MSYREYRNSAMQAVWVLIAANIIIYLVTSFIRGGSLLGLSGAVVTEFGVSRSVIASHPWGILTSIFLHDGIYHILGNMLMLYIYGAYLSHVLSEARILMLYFIGGLVGNAFFLLIAPSDAFAVGASGAIFALGGALAVMRPRAKIVFFFVPMDMWIYIVISGIILGIIPALTQSDIGWQAHLGGLATGLAAGWYFRRWERKRGIYY